MKIYDLMKFNLKRPKKDVTSINCHPGEPLRLECDSTSVGIPTGRIYWEGPRKAKLGPLTVNKMTKGIILKDDYSLNWEHVSRRDRGFYR